jgi:hypothetical protein
MKMGIIIRLHYQPDDPRWPWRLAFFQSMCLPLLLRQKDSDFEIWVRCHPEHEEALRALHPRVNAFQGYQEAEDYFFAETAQEGKRCPRFHIQVRIDADDLAMPGFTAKIRETIQAQAQGEPMVVHFQPQKLDLWRMRVYAIGNPKHRYHRKSVSQFMALYQPSLKEDYRRIYEFNHRHIWETFPRVVTIQEGYCYLVVHGEQTKHTRVVKEDKLLWPR